ncbi:peroxisomal fatty acid beta-oxidation multifunctional protein AIM1-like [Malus sylvestris]|uniref:peroxisomal fatty acid beta-oxidation multifunctional protein AIM1-like n=1 Tax=Malus sylvestris TaxID=3752 RepID=UPI0021AC7A7B|nr:peroxisomal fatty acid beta-oxidation multifunctional protein AIM1-like [Malus sylvestris]
MGGSEEAVEIFTAARELGRERCLGLGKKREVFEFGEKAGGVWKKPVVAAVEGLALGGGLEWALRCHARVAAPRTQLGLPELSLGVIPGLGGTQRLPKLVGLQKAIEMMLSSKPILSEEGKKLSWNDVCRRKHHRKPSPYS